MGTLIEPLATTDEEKQQKTHEFHATAHVLSGELKGPIQYIIDEHAPVAMKDERGGHHKQTKQDVNIEGLISFKTGHSRVSGHKSPKEHRGWITLSTSVMEGLNVFEVLTADRVVGRPPPAEVRGPHPERVLRRAFDVERQPQRLCHVLSPSGRVFSASIRNRAAASPQTPAR